MSKTLVIVLAVVALGMFAIAGSVIYVSQQQQEKPSACNKPYFLYKGECIKVVPKTEPNLPDDWEESCLLSKTRELDGDLGNAALLCALLYD